MTTTLPDFLQNLLANPPRAGGGVHSWLFRVARHLHVHMPAGEIVALLESKVAGCGRVVSRSEILAAVSGSLSAAWQPRGTTYAPISKWPSVDLKRRNQLTQDGPALVDLWELSPVRIEDNESHTEDIVEHLFPGNPLLCCGKSQSDFDCRPRDEWRGELASLAHIVPSPMTARVGITKKGDESAHTLENTGARRFLVCEFDSGTVDEQSAILIHLASFAPMVLAVFSGGKSLHGWFLVAGQPEEKVSRFFRYAVSLGADSAMWTRSQFARMPDGQRDNEKRQTVYFLNYRPLEKL